MAAFPKFWVAIMKPAQSDPKRSAVQNPEWQHTKLWIMLEDTNRLKFILFLCVLITTGASIYKIPDNYVTL